MKIKKLAIIALGIFLLSSSITFAKTVDIDSESLLPRPGESTGDEESGKLEIEYPELGVVGNLPEVTAEGAVTAVIKTILGWTMLLALVAIVVAGIYYLKSEGEEEEIAKAKRILVYLIVGMLVMAASYGIVSGVAKFDFFEPPENLEDE
ncbi:hypothetical protein ACFL21_01810 [Patescibacteria group bacterium]